MNRRSFLFGCVKALPVLALAPAIALSAPKPRGEPLARFDLGHSAHLMDGDSLTLNWNAGQGPISFRYAVIYNDGPEPFHPMLYDHKTREWRPL